MSPTITKLTMTQAGVLLGTAAYMSPEQARRKDVDKRADIWAFGAVWYELLTGERAFEAVPTLRHLAETSPLPQPETRMKTLRPPPTVLHRSRSRPMEGRSSSSRQYDIAREGRFLINTILDSAAAPITLVQNWNPEGSSKRIKPH